MQGYRDTLFGGSVFVNMTTWSELITTDSDRPWRTPGLTS